MSQSYTEITKSLPVNLSYLMREAKIPGISIVTMSREGIISSKTIGVIDKDSTVEVTPETLFGAASLSKPMFAYLVLKLIEANQTHANKEENGLGKFKTEFNLDTPLYEAFPNFLNKLVQEDQEKAKKITARMVLSHTSGIPNHYEIDGKIKLQFEPGEKHAYSGPGIACLQEVMDDLTQSNLETAS